MHFLYPQIDWRGVGPGYVEMEFPIYPYLIAVGYQTFGFHEQIGRILSYGAYLVTLFLFLRLAAFVLPPLGVVVAGLFFVVNPITYRLGTAIQPEAFMMLGYVGAVYAYIRWLDDDRWWWYGWALAFTTFAILAKAPALHLGIVFALFTIWRRGWRAFGRPRLWAFAVAALVPPLLWYVHAHGFWITYGNSLGLSNHRHVVGLASLTNPHFVAGIASVERKYVWSSAGILAVTLALVLGVRLPGMKYGFLWYAAVWAYYLIIAGTAADDWASYYHVVSVPPAALLIGATVAAVALRIRAWDSRTRTRAALAVLAVAAVAAAIHFVRPDAGRIVFAAAAIAAAVGSVVAGRLRVRAPAASMLRASAIGAVACLIVIAPISDVRLSLGEMRAHGWDVEYETARTFARLMPAEARIAESGGSNLSHNESAYETPWYLYWTDHKGYSVSAEDSTMSAVHALVARGIQYFIVEPALAPPGFESEMRRQFPVVAETPVAVLFRIGAQLRPRDAR